MAVFCYAYWPTLQWMVGEWINEPDYSHGFLVIPLSCIIAINRSGNFPGILDRTSILGLGLIAVAIGMRLVGRLIYADFLDAWSMIPLILGSLWYCWGWPAARWALPPVLFLFFLFPLPYRAESLLSWRLQGIATDLSTVFLRILGQPAVSEGHVVWIGAEKLQIEQACSGLRIFVGVCALAFFWAAITTRRLLDQVVLIVAAIPLAIISNALRITAIGLLYLWFAEKDQRNLIHDITGVAMIPIAFGFLWLTKAYWQSVCRPVKQITARELLGAAAKAAPSASK